jgi:hypothetical protein
MLYVISIDTLYKSLINRTYIEHNKKNNKKIKINVRNISYDNNIKNRSIWFQRV